MKSEIKFNEQEIKVAVEIHKKIMELFGEKIPYEIEEDRKFHLITLIFTMSISNFLNSFNIKDSKIYMNDISDLVSQLHDKIRENASYMAFRKNIKYDEGKFQ